MNAVVPLPMFTAQEAVTRFTEVLEEALKRPVGIERLFAKIEELEDQVWLKEAELGRQSGFASI